MNLTANTIVKPESTWLIEYLHIKLYFEGQIASISEVDVQLDVETFEQIKPRATLPPLRDRRAERLHYLGFSFGLTLDLFRFWRKHKFAPFYISQLPVENYLYSFLLNVLTVACMDQSAVTGEHTYFRVRFSKLLSDKFKKMDYKLAMRLTLTLFLFHANLLLAENIGLAKMDAARMVSAAVAARTRSWFLQAWVASLWKYRTNILNRWQNYRKYVSFITIFRPEEYSRVLEPHNVSVNEDLREFHPELLEQFAIGGKEADALEKSKISSSGGSSLHQYRDYQIF
ncbi:hypothetical protein Bca52824_079288 [Brassica carinata]|uniref:N-acetyltransferase domain-containing protein n=1 Tax=Brassica carinata TaxID=52824 RepID=A0A8X7TZY7_BRACI|nr:hypothetical protein Bca52824_079288 [Brassica carinata]